MDNLSSQLFEALSEGVMVAEKVSGKWVIIHANALSHRLVGLKPGTLRGKELNSVLGPGLSAGNRPLFERALAEEKSFSGELTFLSGDEERWTGIRSWFTNVERKPYWFAILEDLGPKRDTKESPGIEEAMQALEKISDGIILIGESGGIRYMNRIAETLTGWHREEVTGKPAEFVIRLVERNSRSPMGDPVGKVLTSGHATGEISSCDLLNRKGRPEEVTYLISPLKSAKGDIVGAAMVLRENPRIRSMEPNQIYLGEMESVSQLAGGIAHDFNNLLMGIQGNLSLAHLEKPGKSLEKRLETAEHATNRAIHLSRQLLSVSRGNSPVLIPGSFSKVVEEACNFSLAGSGVQLEFQRDEELWPCLMDESRISQVLNNILINARQAMNESGRIMVRLANREIGKQAKLPLKPGPYLHIAIEDTGRGIPPDHLDRIFDPFFTTKNEGTGLGLANCLAIIRQHHGHISVESEAGKGTRFNLYLPASPGEEIPEEDMDSQVVYRGNGRVLLMDDDDLVREIAGDLLTHLGYVPEFASSGEEVLQAVKERESSSESEGGFVVIILDLTIPGKMGGLETMKHLEQVAPGIPVIVTSGYSNDPVFTHFREYGFAAVVGKPYSIQQLSLALKTATSGSGLDDGESER